MHLRAAGRRIKSISGLVCVYAMPDVNQLCVPPQRRVTHLVETICTSATNLFCLSLSDKHCALLESLVVRRKFVLTAVFGLRDIRCQRGAENGLQVVSITAVSTSLDAEVNLYPPRFEFGQNSY